MAEKSRPKIKTAKGFAAVSDWSGHPDVKKAIASGNVSAIEAATKKARNEGRGSFNPKDVAVPIAELKDAYKASRSQESAQEATRQEKLENARTYGRRAQQEEIKKGQRKARERRAAGGYDATPTNMYGKPIESFWAEESPPMPEPKPTVPVPEIPAFPPSAPQSASIAERMTDQNYEFYSDLAGAYGPLKQKQYINVPRVSAYDYFTYPSGPFQDGNNFGGYPNRAGGYAVNFSKKYGDDNLRGGSPLKDWSQSALIGGWPLPTRPFFPYYPDFSWSGED